MRLTNNIISQHSPISQQKLLNKLTKTEVEIYKYFISMDKCCDTLYPTRDTIAKKVDCDPRTVSRSTNKLRSLGLIDKKTKRERYSKKCTYRVLIHLDLVKTPPSKFKDSRSTPPKKFPGRILLSTKVTDRNVPIVNSLIPSNFIYNPCTLVPCECKVISSKQESVNERKSSTNRKGNEMKNEIVLMTPAIQDADFILGLTTHGKAKLRAFEDEAIRFALSKLDKARGINNKFEFTVTQALNFSSEKRIGPNWKRYYNLLEAYNIDKDDKEFLIKKEDGEKITKKGYSKSTERPSNPFERKYGELSRQKDSEWIERSRISEEKREASQKDLYAEVQAWRQWTKTDNYKQTKEVLGWTDSQLVAPSVVEIIYNRRIDQDIINMLFLEFPFLEERCLNKEIDPIADLSNFNDNLCTNGFENDNTSTNILFEGSITDESIETLCDQRGSRSTCQGEDWGEC